MVEFANFSDNYADLAVTDVLRGRRPRVEDDTLVLDHAAFVDGPFRLDTAQDAFQAARDAWRTGIDYRAELAPSNGQPGRAGLRKPQLGALHAIAAHWSLTREPAIVVMPTGTGKTEVMVATTVAAGRGPTLVIVPTDALRRQTAAKFLQYGLLKSIGIVNDIPNPVVGVLSSSPRRDQFALLKTCNVVVATMSSIGAAQADAQAGFAELFTDVFFDEAHHVEAITWRRFAESCKHAHVLMFTATPFREDGKVLPGKVIYNFPLSAAQEQDFFRPIHFAEVFEPDQALADAAIAAKAVERLRADLARGLDHVLMARASTIESAERLFADVYARDYTDLNPIVIHTRTKRRKDALAALRAGHHRVVVCVDMFGEGFDLPNLKVAALHSVHKSLGVTLQFIGRFARSAGRVGDATFVANTAEDGVPEALESLYHEDADWNLLLSDLSYDAIDPQARLSDLVSNLVHVGDDDEAVDISTIALRPKTSAQVYRTNTFRPQDFGRAFTTRQKIHQPHISRQDRMLILIANQRDGIDWTDSRDIAIDSWDLYIAYHDDNRNLLYVHSSRKGDSSEKFARAIADDPVLIREEEVFKTFANLRRLVLHSVGLTSRSKNVRYQMFAGLDVRDAIDPLQQQSKMKSNVTGVGYENGKRVSVGCSRKGKLWSMTSGSLADWRTWCDQIGGKLCDANAHPDDFLRYTLIPAVVHQLPASRALMVDWPDQLFESAAFRFEVVAQGRNYDFHSCELGLSSCQPNSTEFTFALKVGDEVEVGMRLRLLPEERADLGYAVEQTSGPAAEIAAFGRRTPIADFFAHNPPLLRLSDGSQLAGNILLRPREELGDTFERDAISSLAWGDTDIRQESRWRDGVVRPRSIQQRFIEHLERGVHAFIIDDDDNGESADVVTIDESAEAIVVTLWHCKYTSGDQLGHRADDLYEVCGQAQKSVKWTWSLPTLVKHLTLRETKHRRGRPTRFIRGSLDRLIALRKASRRKYITFRVGIVQPGLQRAQMPVEHLAILGATSSFLRTVTNHPLLVVASA